MSGICRLPLTSRFKGLKNVSDRNEKSCPICANRQDSHKWERLQTPSRIHSISHESRGQAPINHKHTETKECTMEQEQILNQCRNIARRKGLKIIRAKADGLFIIADAKENWAITSEMSIYSVRSWLNHYEA
jgi:hypothetical protein